VSSGTGNSLSSIDGLSILQSVGSPYVLDEVNLETLDSLSSLRTIQNEIGLKNNDSLSDISGLSNLSSVSGGVVVEYNSNLCQSMVDAFVTFLKGLGWTGDIYTKENDDSC
jgi:hypothetical protein